MVINPEDGWPPGSQRVPHPLRGDPQCQECRNFFDVGFGVWGLGFRIQDLWFLGFGFLVQDLVFLGFTVQDLGFLRFRIWGS